MGFNTVLFRRPTNVDPLVSYTPYTQINKLIMYFFRFKILILINTLCSRGTRERILILFRRREKSRYCVKTANWPPL